MCSVNIENFGKSSPNLNELTYIVFYDARISLLQMQKGSITRISKWDLNLSPQTDYFFHIFFLCICAVCRYMCMCRGISVCVYIYIHPSFPSSIYFFTSLLYLHTQTRKMYSFLIFNCCCYIFI